MVFNEAVFLPIWLRHYGSNLGYENLFVIDDGSNDGSTDDKRIVHLIRKDRGELNEDDRAKQISCFHEELLKYYDVVLYADADEIIVPDPASRQSLSEYISASGSDYINPVGLHVVHSTDKEKPLDMARPLFQQRSYAKFELGYCKPLISKIPMRWKAGFHTSQHPTSLAVDLFMFHLRAMDFDVARERIRNLNSVMLSKHSLQKQQSLHFRMGEQEYLDFLFSRPETESVEDHTPNLFDELETFGTALKADPSAIPSFNISAFEGRFMRVPARFRDVIGLNDGTVATHAEDESSPRSTESRLPTSELYSKAISRALLEKSGTGRNQPCPCGSGKKFKHCHGALA